MLSLGSAGQIRVGGSSGWGWKGGGSRQWRSLFIVNNKLIKWLKLFLRAIIWPVFTPISPLVFPWDLHSQLTQDSFIFISTVRWFQDVEGSDCDVIGGEIHEATTLVESHSGGRSQLGCPIVVFRVGFDGDCSVPHILQRLNLKKTV